MFFWKKCENPNFYAHNEVLPRYISQIYMPYLWHFANLEEIGSMFTCNKCLMQDRFGEGCKKIAPFSRVFTLGVGGRQVLDLH